MANNSRIKIAADFERLYPGASAKATETVMNLVFTADLLLKRIAGLLKPFDLTPASALVLSALADSAHPMAPHEIAERLIISRATVTGLIDSLERRGYALRVPHPTDRRMLTVELTDSGRVVAHAFRPIVHLNQKAWLQGLSEADQDRLIATLHRVQSSLSQESESEPE